MIKLEMIDDSTRRHHVEWVRAVRSLLSSAGKSAARLRSLITERVSSPRLRRPATAYN